MNDDRPTLEPSPSEAAVPRDYWPTAGWRTAAPEDHGIDSAALAEIEGQVAKGYPHVRSVLVVRHGYLVYEAYWHGLDQTAGHDVRSVTKSVVATLVGIALAEGKIKSLDQTVGELLAAQSPIVSDRGHRDRPVNPRLCPRQALRTTGNPDRRGVRTGVG